MARTLTELVRRLKPTGPVPALPDLIFMTDPQRTPEPWALVGSLPKGCAVIVRHPDADARRVLAARMSEVCRRSSLVLIVAADPRLASSLNAGLHLPEWALRCAPRRWASWRRPGRLVTAAAHAPAAVHRAAAAGVDAVLLSPVLPTASHPGARAIGPLRFAKWCRDSAVPVYALGGVSERTARRLAASGASGFAGISGLTARL